ncbi:helix-turn-helix transcriptional regulator [Candidatus Nitrotoga arctica]|nr:helix-turn-helix transcriptional regulator [Candidatus Nitrotoga arctica]
MTVEELDTALAALEWKVSDFCRATGLHRNTPSRWRNEAVPIPEWVPKHLSLLLEVKRLSALYVVPPKIEE